MRKSVFLPVGTDLSFHLPILVHSCQPMHQGASTRLDGPEEQQPFGSDTLLVVTHDAMRLC